MARCLQCGAEIASGVKFCRSCGAAAPVTTGAACSSCGKVNEAGAKFCKGCGNTLDGTAAHQPTSLAVESDLPSGPGCGATHKPESRLCKGCDPALSQAAVPQAAKIETSPAPFAPTPAQEEQQLATAVPCLPVSAVVPPHSEPPLSKSLGVPEPETSAETKQESEPEEAVSPATSLAKRVLRVLLVAAVLGGIAMGSFSYFRSHQVATPAELASSTEPMPVASSGTPPQPPVALQKPVPDVDNASKGESPLRISDDATGTKPASVKPAKKNVHNVKRLPENGTGSSAVPLQPKPQENDIYKQLEEKKRRLGIQ